MVRSPRRPWRRGRRRRQSVQLSRNWLGVIDIDHFKRVNDSYGHLIGDEVLLLMSRLMRSSFRFDDRLYRFGGEEFVVLMRCADGDAAAQAFERLNSTSSATCSRRWAITVSIGFTELKGGDTPNGAFERADKAVYFAKGNGRNQVRHHADLVSAGHPPTTPRSATWSCSESGALLHDGIARQRGARASLVAHQRRGG